jgi:hypothetical protein
VNGNQVDAGRNDLLNFNLIPWPLWSIESPGLDHRVGPAKAFYSARQELTVAQTACRLYKIVLVRPKRVAVEYELELSVSTGDN